MCRSYILTSLALLAVVCSPQPVDLGSAGTAIFFEGARIIVGDGKTVIEDAAFVVEDGLFTAVGRRVDLPIPRGAIRVDLSGTTVMPALVDLHSHLGYTDIATMSTASEYYVRERLVDHLNRFAYHGIGVTLSLGLDRGELPFQLRADVVSGAARFLTAGRGIAMPNAGPLAQHWRDAAYGVTSEDEARAAVRELAAADVDMVKIWVDDRNGTVAKLPPSLYGPIIEEAHARGLRVVAHVFYLADAKALLEAGVDGFAHGVRDLEVDDEFMALMKERPGVFLIPNLPNTAPGLGDLQLIAETLPPAQIEQMRESLAGEPPARPRSFDVQALSLARMSAAGVRIGFGTDAGTGAPLGWSAHAELADMVAAGLTPAEAIRAATQTSAGIIGLDELGLVAAGKSADFIVLEANPLDDITHTRRIADVYLRGRPVDRGALRLKWTGSP